MTSRRPRRHTLDLGGYRAVKIGRPSAATDLYYATMATNAGLLEFDLTKLHDAHPRAG